MVGLGRGFVRSRNFGRRLSKSRRKMVTKLNTKAMTSNTRPRRARINKGTMTGPNAAERGGFISNLALQWGQARCVQASRLRKNGVRTSELQAGHFAIDRTPFISTFRLTWPSDRVNGTKSRLF